MEQTAEKIFRELGVVSAAFTLSDTRSIGRTRGGDLTPTAYGRSLWQGTFTIRPYRWLDMEAIEARMETLIQTDGTFLLCPPARANVPQVVGSITAISGPDRRILTATLSEGQAEGDYLGTTYDGGRRGLHRIAARNGGNIILVTPLARTVAVGDPAIFGRPNLRAVADSGGYGAPTYAAPHADGLSLSWTQTLERP